MLMSRRETGSNTSSLVGENLCALGATKSLSKFRVRNRSTASSSRNLSSPDPSLMYTASFGSRKVYSVPFAKLSASTRTKARRSLSRTTAKAVSSCVSRFCNVAWAVSDKHVYREKSNRAVRSEVGSTSVAIFGGTEPSHCGAPVACGASVHSADAVGIAAVYCTFSSVAHVSAVPEITWKLQLFAGVTLSSSRKAPSGTVIV
mmetsp:Transcript_29738/g.76305  ORF Transcript_29738/g.76305 Transcript_29738/m.76305 type:complete len:203 (+) Transcript_29738:4167-4775(+)